MMANVFSPRFTLLYVFIVSAVFVHFRDQIRHWIPRQLKQNVEGEAVGILNRLFGYAYRVRLVGEQIETRTRFAYYYVKYALLGPSFYRIFLK